jgi:hypothetical protein
VAASVAATESGARRDFLLRVPYSADTHDPEKTLRRHREYGDHDPQITGPPKPAADREWQRPPQVKEVALITTAWLRDFAEIQEMEEVGKLSPEAQQFISHRLRAFVKTLEDWLDSADTMEEVVAIPDRAAEMHD